MTPQRIQLRRVKGWRKPEGAVVVARPSRWGNPWRADDYAADYPDSSMAGRRRMAVSDFRGMVEGRWEHEGRDGTPTPYPSRAAIVEELAGRDLACWCPLDEPCHADVLLEAANA